MDAELRERFMSTIRKKNKPDGFTAKDVEVAAAGMVAAGKGRWTKLRGKSRSGAAKPDRRSRGGRRCRQYNSRLNTCKATSGEASA